MGYTENLATFETIRPSCAKQRVKIYICKPNFIVNSILDTPFWNFNTSVLVLFK